MLRIDHAVIVRACRGVIAMPALLGHGRGDVLMWRRGADADAAIQCTPDGKDLIRPFPAKALVHELEGVD